LAYRIVLFPRGLDRPGVDKSVSLHERLTPHVHRAIDTSLQYAWVIPYGIVLVALAIVYARFLLVLSPGPRNLFLAAAGGPPCPTAAFFVHPDGPSRP